MIDPLAEVVTLLQPGALFSKVASGAGRWSVRRSEAGRPFYCAVLEGTGRLAVDGRPPLLLEAGDFVLIPAAFDFTASSREPPTGNRKSPHAMRDGETRHGRLTGPADVRMIIGYCTFASPDASLLVSLLPQLVHVRGVARLSALVQLVADESRAQRPARAVVLARLLEVLLIEALRSASTTSTQPGLVHGLADDQLAAAIRIMHEHPAKPWTVAQLARSAALSRSAFFDRFTRTVGVAPMTYLLGWRMALAKDLILRAPISVGEVARRVGYSSASTFSVAFTRYVGEPPTTFARNTNARAVADSGVKARPSRAQYTGS
ncbi:MAG TPA: AraC family transcriptional regulator [Kofleriaceae bacterium]|jgi:AraC-like DNA-binding protein|nr:AraC family transcriptional regulator [Kofleriaceae bacterium]